MRFLVLLLALCAIPIPGRAGEPPQGAFLRVEAGGHAGAVVALALDASGRMLATTGFDKTVRLWSLPDGAARGILRPPIGPGTEGELYAVALSPDGGRVYAAGSTGGLWDATFCVYVFDTGRMALAGLLGGLAAPVNALAVSADGRFLAAGLAQGGVRMWDAASGKPVFEDHAYAGPVRAIAVDRQGRLFSASADGHVRAYDPAGRKTADTALASGVRPWGLALSPDGGLVAVTGEAADKQGRLHVDVLSARTLAPVFAPDTTGLAGEGLLAVAWAADGHGGVQLLAGGYARSAQGTVLRRWPDFGLGPATDIVVARDTIRALLAVPTGGAVFAAEDPGWGRVDGDGSVALRPVPPLADLRPARDRLAMSADGAVVEVGAGRATLRFSVARRLLARGPADGALRPARPPERLTGWRDGAAPALGGVKLALNRGEFSRSAAVLPDGRFLLGTDTHLRLFAPDGTPIMAVPLPEAAWAVAAGDGVVVAALLDGTLRWYGLDGPVRLAERAALFAHADGRRWVLFTPDGFFDDADGGGDELVGLHLNRGRNQQPAWLSFSQAYRVLHAPALVRAALLGDAAPAQAKLAELGDIRALVTREPSVAIADACAPAPDGSCRPVAVQSGETVLLPADARALQVTLKLADRGAGLGPLDMFVNGRNAGRAAPPSPGLPAIVTVPLDPGDNFLTVRAYDAAAKIFGETAPLRLHEATPGETPRPRLFVLSVGIDHFANKDLTLQSAVADSAGFAGEIAAGAAPLFREVAVTHLTEAQATRAGILAALDRLAGEVRPVDVFLFYVATHGVRDEDDDRFLLVAQDMADVSSWAAMAKQSIDEGTLIAALSRIPARDALLFLDTCHAGKVPADALANVGHETGRYILAASGSVQEALDTYDGRNGVFIVALHEALTGRAGADSDGNLGALALGEYVSRRVGQLAREKGHDQDAVFRAAQADLRSFPVVRVAR